MESTWHINALALQAANCLFENRQFDHSGSYQQNGRHPIRSVSGLDEKSDYALSRRITVTAEHLVGVENTEANQENRGLQELEQLETKYQSISHSVPGLGSFQDRSFADRLNCQLDKFVNRKPDPAAEAVDAFHVNWSQLKGYAFPQFEILGRCVVKVVEDRAILVVITPTWHTQPWFPGLLSMTIASPILFPPPQHMLMPPQQERHPLVSNETLSLAAWKMSGERQKQAFQRTLPPWLSEHGEEARKLLTVAPGQSGLADVVVGRLIRLMPLWQM